ncbi:MAG: hypothetical protein JXB47_12565 [Anaerolineae bacterium]|nr:hypothetical protein [Anaerolineae bacterium]
MDPCTTGVLFLAMMGFLALISRGLNLDSETAKRVVSYREIREIAHEEVSRAQSRRHISENKPNTYYVTANEFAKYQAEQAQPATKQDEIAQLREEVATLRAELESLRAEAARLRDDDKA